MVVDEASFAQLADRRHPAVDSGDIHGLPDTRFNTHVCGRVRSRVVSFGLMSRGVRD